MKKTAPSEAGLSTRARIARFVQAQQQASRREIAQALDCSMPTVISNVSELIGLGLIREAGEYGSTGGRKSKVLSVCGAARQAVGLDVTPQNIRILLLDLAGRVLAEELYSLPFADSLDYYRSAGRLLDAFLCAHCSKREQLLGVGMSLPGFLSADQDLLLHSDVLGVENVSLKRIRAQIPLALVMDNDANCAAYAEVDRRETTAYVFLSSVVGGAIYVDGKLSEGQRHKSGEFGHMILHRGGRRCYCGKQGCMDAYCSATALRGSSLRLEDFFARLAAEEPAAIRRWEAFLDDLALSVSNIRMALDCKIILGGHLGCYIGNHLDALSEKVRQYNGFDADMSYVTAGRFGLQSSAVGAAQMVLHQYLDRL